MKTARKISLPLLLLLALIAVSFEYYPTQRPPTVGVAGSVCRPPHGFRSQPCGRHEILDRVVEPACEYIWGPNVCLFTDTLSSSVLEYRYDQGCDWVYSHYYYTWVRQCNYVCQSTSVCLLHETESFNTTYVQCCPGFSARAVSSTRRNPYNLYHYSYYIRLRVEPEGCPVAVADTLLECLEIHGLEEFLSYIDKSVYASYFNQTTSSHVTLFVPTNEVLRDAREINIIPEPTNTLFNISQLVGNHLVPDNVTMASLRLHGDKIYVNVEGANLHKVTVSVNDYSSVSYSENPYYYNPYSSGSPFTIVTPFINGAEVVNADSCKTENATLHIINRVLAPTDSTIADYLTQDSNEDLFSMFTGALETVGILQFLDNPDVSRTVFAITNEAFAAAFPPALMNCVANYMRNPLNRMLLYHIGIGAHYSSSLSRNNFFYTLLEEFLAVRVNKSSGDIFLGRCRVPIIEPDVIMASNGVIHIIDGILFPESFNFGMCQGFVPEPSPVECPEPPSPSPSPSPTPTNVTIDRPSTLSPLPPMATPEGNFSLINGP